MTSTPTQQTLRFGPAVSRAAAATVDHANRKGEVLALLERAWPEGLTAGELVEKLHGTRAANCVARRCRDLAYDGKVEEAGRRRGPLGRDQIVWRYRHHA